MSHTVEVGIRCLITSSLHQRIPVESREPGWGVTTSLPARRCPPGNLKLPRGNLWSCRACTGATARASASPASPSIWMCQRALGSHRARDRCSGEGAMFHQSVNMSLGSHEGTSCRGLWGRGGREKERERGAEMTEYWRDGEVGANAM